MRDPNWYPSDTHFNIYNREDFQRSASGKDLREHGNN